MFYKYLLVFLCLFLSTFLFAKGNKLHPALKLIQEAQNNNQFITPKDLYTSIQNEENIIVLDVRELIDRSEGQIYADDYFAITRGNLEFYVMAQIKDTNANLVTFCRAGKRGALAAQTLKKLGYKNVRYLKGGLRSWAKAGYPIETAIGVTRLVPQDNQ